MNRLKIPDHPAPSRKSSALLTFVLCLLSFGLGFGLSRGLDYFQAASALEVRSTVVSADSSSVAGRAAAAAPGFTAGGWIEVAVPAYPLLITSRLSERIEAILVHEGQTVEPGQTLARLYDADYRNRLAIAEARRGEAAGNLAKMRAGYRSEDIEAAVAVLAERTEAVRLASADYERDKKLSRETISPQKLDASLSAYTKAKALEASANAELAKMRAGYRPEDITVAEAQVKTAEAQVALAKNDLEHCTIRAPEQGPSLSVLKLLHKVGDWIPEKENREILSLYDPKNLQARVDVTQSRIGEVRVGGNVLIRTEADTQRQYHGTVLRAEPLADLAKNTITVRAHIDNPDLLLFPEMVAQITFMGKEASEDENTTATAGMLFIPREAIRNDSKGAYVFISNEGEAKRRDVTTGETKGNRIAITKGLFSGQRVILDRLEELNDGTPIKEKKG